MSSFSIPVPKVLLVLLNAALLSLSIKWLWQGNHSAEIAGTQAAQVTVPALSIDVEREPRDFLVIRKRALFYSTRDFYVPPDPAMTALLPPKPNYRLTGTFVAPQKGTVALLLGEGGGAPRKVMIGEDLDGWRVTLVESARVRMELGGQTHEISSAKRTVSAGLSIQPMARTGQAAPIAGIRILGSGGVASSINSRLPLITEPRLYQPPAP